MVLPRPGPAPPPAPLAGPGSGAKERREALVSHLRDRGSTSVAELPELFGVSIETIRRDLRLLESTGRIRRSYGRVTAAESGSFESSREFRVTHLTDEKERIAQAAGRQANHLGGNPAFPADAQTDTTALHQVGPNLRQPDVARLPHPWNAEHLGHLPQLPVQV